MDGHWVVVQTTPLPSQALTFFRELSTTESRLAVSGGIIVATLVVAHVLAPWVLRGVARFVWELIPSGRAADTANALVAVIPTTVRRALLRILQFVLYLLAAISLLVIWGLVDLAWEILILIWLSIPFLAQIATTLGLALIAYGVSDVLTEAIDRFANESDRMTEHQNEIVVRLTNLGIIALFVSAVLTIWGVDLSGLLVGAGFLGIVVGLAARQTLSSLIAGFVLMFSRPFTIGDWVLIGEDSEGIVTEITIMNTRLENFDGETIVIPNDRVNNQPITNRSRRGHYRIRLDVGIDYDSDPDTAVDVAQETLATVDVVADSPPPRVIPKSFGDSAVMLELRFWIDPPMPPRKWRAIEAVVTKIKRRFDEEDIKIPFPQRELSGRSERGGFQLAGNSSQTDGDDAEGS